MIEINYDNIFNLILPYILSKKDVVKEYELLKILEDNDLIFIDRINNYNLSLYRAHFILMHCLYKLKYFLNENLNLDLEIICVNIKVIPFIRSKDENSITNCDSLANFYLNLENMENTTEEEVRQMIEDFWKNINRYNLRVKALNELGLDENATDEDIKRAYITLVKKYHPDLNGDHEKMIKINNAMEILRR